MKRDSLSRLIARSLGLADVVQPVLPARFEPIGRVPLPTLAGLGTDEEPESVEPVPHGFRSAVTPTEIPPAASHARVERTQGSRPEPEEDVNTAGRFAATPGYVSPRATGTSLGSDLSPNVVAGVPPDEGLAGKPPYQSESLVPASVRPKVAFAAEELPGPTELDRPPGRLTEREQMSRHITPAEIRVRAQGPAEPSTRTEPEAQRFLRAASTGQERSQESKVTVHIGRIEVRAVLTPASQPERKHPVDNRQRLTLSDYLKQREKGAR